MPKHMLAALINDATQRRLAGGEHLFRRNDRAGAVFTVDSGRLRLIRHGQDGRPLTLLVAGPGELFAEAALFSERYHCDAVADIPSTVTVYPKTAAVRRLREDPELSWRLLTLQTRQVQQLRTRLELSQIRPASERVWQYLLLSADSDRLPLDRPLKDMASDIGLSHEAFYRALAALQDGGKIRRDDGIIYLCI